MDIFTDFTLDRHDHKAHALITKREFNPELSAFSNMVLDIQDFRDRVRPMANDLALMDATRVHQRQSVNDIEAEKLEMMKELDFNKWGGAQQDAGYSSGELSESSTINQEQAQPEVAQQLSEPEPMEEPVAAEPEPVEEPVAAEPEPVERDIVVEEPEPVTVEKDIVVEEPVVEEPVVAAQEEPVDEDLVERDEEKERQEAIKKRLDEDMK